MKDDYNIKWLISKSPDDYYSEDDDRQLKLEKKENEEL